MTVISTHILRRLWHQKRMMDAAGVRYHQYHRTNRKIEIELNDAGTLPGVPVS